MICGGGGGVCLLVCRRVCLTAATDAVAAARCGGDGRAEAAEVFRFRFSSSAARGKRSALILY
jgi:hypothetical protein